MNRQPSTGEHIIEKTGDLRMDKKAQEMIREAKEIKRINKITYIDIMEQMERTDPSSVVSLSTLRRVFRDGSESKASSFNFAEILTPIYDAVVELGKKPPSESERDQELDGYKAVIRVQNEELDRLLELKEHLDARVDYLVGQTNTKDEQITFLMKQLDEKGETIRRLMEKFL